MKLTVLNVAFPLSTVSRDSVGGAEQILFDIDRGLTERGHTSLVIGSPDSSISGRLIPTVRMSGAISDVAWAAAHEATRKAISFALENYPVDLVHMHGVDFADYLPRRDLPVLITLHLPLRSYPAAALNCRRPRTYFHCVSVSQRRYFSPYFEALLNNIENGVRTDLLRPDRPIRKSDFVLSLGRICPEKGFHIAIRAAKAARMDMILAGHVFPFEAHQRYFDEKIAPELDGKRRYIGALAFERKKELLASALCLVVPTLVPETSSLAARESLACGTPVVGFPWGSLPDVVDHGKTGFIVSGPHELPGAIRACSSLDPAACRRAAEQRFDCERMINQYITCYRHILDGSWASAAAA